MRPLTRETIEAYVDREEPYDCAGSAKIEKLGIALMETVESDDPTSLIGLPLMALTTLLTQSGVTVLPGLKPDRCRFLFFYIQKPHRETFPGAAFFRAPDQNPRLYFRRSSTPIARASSGTVSTTAIG